MYAVAVMTSVKPNPVFLGIAIVGFVLTLAGLGLAVYLRKTGKWHK